MTSKMEPVVTEVNNKTADHCSTETDTIALQNGNSDSVIVEAPLKEFNKTETSNLVEPDADAILEEKLQCFFTWCKENNLNLSNKVTVQFKETSHRYGMVSTNTIKKGEVLFTVPRTVLLHSNNSSIADSIVDHIDWLEALQLNLEDTSGWVPLLITLMHEYNEDKSFWSPYLNLVPKPSEFGHPLFWSDDDQKKYLQGMSLCSDIHRDQQNMEYEYYHYVLPFFQRNKDMYPEISKYNLILYKQMVAFIMAYSFTEDLSPAMIPMADILNHHSNNNAHLVFDKDCLNMMSTKKINAGEEIFNTFGKLGNAELLQMYGYVEMPINQYDSVPVSLISFMKVMVTAGKLPLAYVQAMFSFLDKTGIAAQDEFFLFDQNGFRNGPDLLQMLKILHMSESEFEATLTTRAGRRADSFYKQLLRKLKLSKKTCISSGVPVIDITDEETDNMNVEDYSEKRKQVDLHEVCDGEEVSLKRQRMLNYPEHQLMPMHLAEQSMDAVMVQQTHQHENHVQLSNCSHPHRNVEDKRLTIGHTESSAIVIDDDDSDNEGYGDACSNDSSVIVSNQDTPRDNLIQNQSNESSLTRSDLRKEKNVNNNTDKQDESHNMLSAVSFTSNSIHDKSIDCLNKIVFEKDCANDKSDNVNAISPGKTSEITVKPLEGSSNVNRIEINKVDADLLKPDNLISNNITSKSNTQSNYSNNSSENAENKDENTLHNTALTCSKDSNIIQNNSYEKVLGTDETSMKDKTQDSVAIKNDIKEIAFCETNMQDEKEAQPICHEEKEKIFSTEKGTPSVHNTLVGSETLEDISTHQKKTVHINTEETNLSSLINTPSDTIQKLSNTLPNVTVTNTDKSTVQLKKQNDGELLFDESSFVKKTINPEISKISAVNSISNGQPVDYSVDAYGNEHESETDEVMDSNDEDSDEEEDSDNDEIEFLNENIGCTISYEKLNSTLPPQWKDLLRKVTEKEIAFLATGHDLSVDIDITSMSRNGQNAYRVRKGQYQILKRLLTALA